MKIFTITISGNKTSKIIEFPFIFSKFKFNSNLIIFFFNNCIMIFFRCTRIRLDWGVSLLTRILLLLYIAHKFLYHRMCHILLFFHCLILLFSLYRLRRNRESCTNEIYCLCFFLNETIIRLVNWTHMCKQLADDLLFICLKDAGVKNRIAFWRNLEYSFAMRIITFWISK